MTIPDEEQDRQLPDKLRDELPGILNWALEGLAEWREHGIGYPSEVKTATDEYRVEQDYLRDFLADTTIGEPEAYATHKELFLSYLQWCDENHDKAPGSKRFSQMMAERGYDRGRFGSNRDRGFGGRIARGQPTSHRPD